MQKIIPHLYIFLWLLYYQQDGTTISRIILVLLLLMSLYYFGFALIRYRLPLPMKVLAILVIGWTFYGVYPILDSGYEFLYIADTRSYVQPFTELKGIYCSILPIFSFYVFTKRDVFTEKAVKRWFWAFLAMALFTYSQFHESETLKYGKEEITNNYSYVILSLLPFIPLYYKRPVLQYLILSICLLCVLLGFKRGAILIGVIAAGWFIYTTFRSNNSMHSRKKIIRIVMVIIMLLLAVNAIYYLLNNSDYFNVRITNTVDGDTSGRDILYQSFLHHLLSEKNILNFLFGNGAYGTVRISGNYAHNDWLEIAIDYGLVFLIIYMFFWTSLFLLLWRSRNSSVYSMIITLFFIIYFLKTFFSMSYNNITIYAACAFGYAFARYTSYLKKNITTTSPI